MKKVLAIFLSVLLICVVAAPVGYAGLTPDISTKVIDGEYDGAASAAAVVTKTTFTVAIVAPAVDKLTGVNLYLSFDPAVLSVANAGAAGIKDGDGNITPFFSGIPVNGFKRGSNSEYSFGWISSSGVSKAEAKDIFYVTFNVIDTTKAATSLNLYVDEFRTEDGNDGNDVVSTVLAESSVINFSFPDGTPPVTSADTTAPADDDSATAGDINSLLQVIRDMLDGNNVSLADFADAITNLIGNAEISDMIEQLVDGDIDITDLFKNFLAALGIDFDTLEDLLNKIIEFFKGLFGGGEEPAESTTAANNATTAAGSTDGSQNTGDTSLVLASVVCVMASAAFVLTRKKRETVQ